MPISTTFSFFLLLLLLLHHHLLSPPSPHLPPSPADRQHLPAACLHFEPILNLFSVHFK